MKKTFCITLCLIFLLINFFSISYATGTDIMPFDPMDTRVAEMTKDVEDEYGVFLDYCLEKLQDNISKMPNVDIKQVCIVVPTKEMTVYMDDGFGYHVGTDSPFIGFYLVDNKTNQKYTFVGWNAVQGPVYKNPGPFYTVVFDMKGPNGDYPQVFSKTCATNDIKIYIVDMKSR